MDYLKKTIMYKNNIDPFKGHNFRRLAYRHFAKATLLFLFILCAVASCGNALAASDTPLVTGTWVDFVWPVLGVAAFIWMVVWPAMCFPCYGYSPTEPQGYPTTDTDSLHWTDLVTNSLVEPTKPWSVEPDTEKLRAAGYFDKTEAPEAPEAPHTRATDRTPIPERRANPAPFSESHKDDLGVLLFSFAMKTKLAVCRESKGRHGWYDPEVVTDDQLELGLLLVMRKGDVVDIANYCMFLHERGIKQIKRGVKR